MGARQPSIPGPSASLRGASARSTVRDAPFFYAPGSSAFPLFCDHLQGVIQNENVQCSRDRRDRHGRAALLPAVGKSPLVPRGGARRLPLFGGQTLPRSGGGPLGHDLPHPRKIRGHGGAGRGSGSAQDRRHGRLRVLRRQYEERGDQGAGRAIRQGGGARHFQQLGAPLHPRRADDHSRDQPRARGDHPRAAQAAGHAARLHRRQEQLLAAKLRPRPAPAALVRRLAGRRLHLPGDQRRGQDLRPYARDPRQRHPLYRRRGGKIRARAAQDLGHDPRRRDRLHRFAQDHGAVPARARVRRAYGGGVRLLRKKALQRTDPGGVGEFFGDAAAAAAAERAQAVPPLL